MLLRTKVYQTVNYEQWELKVVMLLAKGLLLYTILLFAFIKQICITFILSNKIKNFHFRKEKNKNILGLENGLVRK